MYQPPVENRDDQMVDNHQIEEGRANFPEVEERRSVLAESFTLCFMSVVSKRYDNGIYAVEHPPPIGLELVLVIVVGPDIVVRDSLIGDPPDSVQVAECAECRVVAI